MSVWAADWFIILSACGNCWSCLDAKPSRFAGRGVRCYVDKKRLVPANMYVNHRKRDQWLLILATDHLLLHAFGIFWTCHAKTWHSFQWRTTSLSIQMCISSDYTPHQCVAPLTLNWSCAQHLKNLKHLRKKTKCYPSTKPCNTSLPCTSPTSHHLPTSIYHSSPVPCRFQTPTAAFHWCTLAAPKAWTPFKQHHSDKHMANELRLCSIYVEYSSVVIIHHNFHHTSYISFYIFEHLLWHAQQNSQEYHKKSQ